MCKARQLILTITVLTGLLLSAGVALAQPDGNHQTPEQVPVVIPGVQEGPRAATSQAKATRGQLQPLALAGQTGTGAVSMPAGGAGRQFKLPIPSIEGDADGKKSAASPVKPSPGRAYAGDGATERSSDCPSGHFPFTVKEAAGAGSKAASRGYSADGGITGEEPEFLLDPYQVGYVLVANILSEPWEIYIDERHYGRVLPGEYATYLVHPGSNRFLARSQSNEVISDSFRSRPGQLTYYYLSSAERSAAGAPAGGK
jgi:hypothetical protein